MIEVEAVLASLEDIWMQNVYTVVNYWFYVFGRMWVIYQFKQWKTTETDYTSKTFFGTSSTYSSVSEGYYHICVCIFNRLTMKLYIHWKNAWNASKSKLQANLGRSVLYVE